MLDVEVRPTVIEFDGSVWQDGCKELISTEGQNCNISEDQ